MKFDFQSLEKMKQARNGVSYHSAVMADCNQDGTPFKAYNKSLSEGREHAADIIAAYRNPRNTSHSEAYDAYKANNFNQDDLTDSCTEQAMKKNGARKLCMRNTAYENSVFNAIKPVTQDDHAAVNAFAETMASVFHTVGYEHEWTPAVVAEEVFNKYPISNKEKAINALDVLHNSAFPTHKRLKKTTEAAIAENLKAKGDAAAVPSQMKYTSVANRMAKLQGY